MINWKELIVTSADGEFCGTLGEIVHADYSSMIKVVRTVNGILVSWDGHFISAEDEEPQWDTPKGEVDWDGFQDALDVSRLEEREELIHYLRFLDFDKLSVKLTMNELTSIADIFKGAESR